MSASGLSSITPDERYEFVDRMLELHEEIAGEIVKPEMDPGKLMRLTAAGVNQCIMGVATLLVQAGPRSSESTDDPRQLQLFDGDDDSA